MTAQPLHVEVVLPPAPYALATVGFLTTLATVEQEIAATASIDTPDAAQQAANIQARLTQAGSALEKQRVALKQPFLAAGKAIDDAAKAPASRIEAAKGKVKQLLADYDRREREKAAEAERQRLAEIKRLEDIARKEKEEEKRKADLLVAQLRPVESVSEATLKLVASKNPEEIVAKAEPVGDRFRPLVTYPLGTSAIMAGPALFLTAAEATAHAQHMIQAARDAGKIVESAIETMEMPDDEPPAVVQKTETEKAIEQLQHAPAVVAQKPLGITYRTMLIATVVDANALPDMFVERVPRMAAIRSTFCAGWTDAKPVPVVPGVKFEVRREPVATGR